MHATSRYFSYVDTALRMIYFNIKSSYDNKMSREIERIMRVYDTAPFLKNKLFGDIVKTNLNNNTDLSELFFHEWHHYLQSIAYPYLYYLSYMELKTLLSTSEMIRQHPENIDLSDDKMIQVNNEVYNNLTYQTYNYQFIWNDDKLEVNNLLTNPDSDNNVFSITDLIENSTSIFHYKAIRGESANASDYWKWLRNPSNKCYKNLFLFLSNQIGFEETYKLLPLLTLLCFYTTEPLHAFCTLYNKKEFFAHDLDLNLQVGKKLLEYSYDSLFFSIEDYSFIETTPVGMITETQFEKILVDTASFPLSFPANRFFRNKNELEKCLLSNNPASLKKLFNDFQPIAVHYNFSDFLTRDTAIIYNLETPEIIGIPTEMYLGEMTKLKDITTTLISKFNKGLPKNCHHTECSFFDTEFCHRWNAVPKEHVNCHFPSWFAINFHKEIIPKERLLRHLSEQEIEKYQLIYERLLERFKSKFHYYYVEEYDVYNLIILKEQIRAKDVNYVQTFIQMLLQTHTLEEIGNKFFFSFDEYEDDNEEVFEIIEIIEWFQELKRNLPELFYYIRFENDLKRCNYMPYLFMRHNVQHFENKTFTIDTSPEDWQSFIENEYCIFDEFCKKHQLNLETHFTNTFLPLSN